MVNVAQVKAVRAFNRFYTRRIGVLDRYLGSDFSLTEVRILYELAHRPHLTATDLVRELGLDAGYLSRILRRFTHEGWVERETAAHDGRQSLLKLTEAGYAAFAPLQQKSREEAAELLASLPAKERPKLLSAMDTLHQLLDPATKRERQVTLRGIQPGDMGWVVMQHGELYAREYGFTNAFEALVADIAAKFIRDFDPEWERGWIAEVDGERAGSVFCVRKSATVAKLRLLILVPEARGLGLGGKLVDECIAFARGKGYRKLVLWTNGHLLAARAIYQSRGFVLKETETTPTDYCPRHPLVNETWELKL
ncbi:bifunctional helix-turn-helix transcriptional regulator/GNAT family N-acetyltransferase [Ramlibacter albus]|uniref:MarR family transcriptional regulator n=1 Tax=Ramlibacter albus TaxID=2079448 RepID=A0A923S203_9BURK|nr:bifunctional helix-turn-helix transcriptional regulator/GNAT family N-acetyltransferase [Ramlibacter albus]MBC5764243.1 MarR family transcriptional regulator [Ramlibacter albus]